MTFVKAVSGDAWTLAQKLVCMCDCFSLTLNDFCRVCEAWEHPLKLFGPIYEAGLPSTLKQIALKCGAQRAK